MKRNIGAAHYMQMLAYAEHAHAEGWYYGNREQFDRRHAQIVAFLVEAVERCERKKPKGQT